MMKAAILWLVLGIALVASAVWLIADQPNESYDYGYTQAFVEADRLWFTKMPPGSTCDAMAAEAIRRDGALYFDDIVAGCHSGYYDAVTDTRGRLGYPPLP